MMAGEGSEGLVGDLAVNLLGVMAGALLGYYFTHKFEKKRARREADAKVAAVRASLGLGLGLNLIALRRMRDLFRLHEVPPALSLYAGHFQLDHALAHAALTASQHEDFMSCAAMVEHINYRNEHTLDVELRMRMRLSEQMNTSDIADVTIDSTVKERMRTYLKQFEDFSEKLESALEKLLEGLDPSRLTQANTIRPKTSRPSTSQ